MILHFQGLRKRSEVFIVGGVVKPVLNGGETVVLIYVYFLLLGINLFLVLVRIPSEFCATTLQIIVFKILKIYTT